MTMVLTSVQLPASRDHSLHAARTFRSKWIRARQVHSRPPVGRKATLMGHFADVFLARDAPDRKIIWLLIVNNGNTTTCAVERGETSNQVQLHTQFLAIGASSPPIEQACYVHACIQRLHVHRAFRHCLLKRTGTFCWLWSARKCAIQIVITTRSVVSMHTSVSVCSSKTKITGCFFRIGALGLRKGPIL